MKTGVEFLNDIRRINVNVLPICYDDNFYQRIKKLNPIVIKISEDEKDVGGIIGWKEKGSYILGTLAVYTKYQEKGYGSKLLDYFIQQVKTTDVKRIEVQVQEDNNQAKMFYEKHKFTKCKVIPKAYPRLKNPKGIVYELCMKE